MPTTRPFRLFLLTLLGLAALAVVSPTLQAAEDAYLRWPDLDDEIVVFACEGDLWKAPATGGPAIRLTTHPEEESSPVISPDGSRIAFDASYDGPREVYVMPLSGGIPKQITFEGGGASVRGWTASGRVVFRSNRVAGPSWSVLRTVDPASLDVETLPLMNATDSSPSADESTWFFTRFGIRTTGDNTRLYRGGSMAQLWRFQPGLDNEAQRLAPELDAPIRNPMQWNARIWFLSDASGFTNVWSVDEDGGDATRHTDFSGFEPRSPRMHEGTLV